MSSKRAIGDVRPSQVITTFGPGAIVDLQTLSVIVAGIDDWRREEDDVIHEKRLENALGVKQFFAARMAEGEFYNRKGTVPAHLFPRYQVCTNNKCATLSEFGAEDFVEYREKFQELVCKAPGCPGRGKFRATTIPAPFIVACPSGHLDDFPWRTFVHRGETTCKKRMRLISMGETGTVADLMVMCSCKNNETGKNKARSVSDAFGLKGSENLGDCSKRRPWLGKDNYDKTCKHHDQVKALQRGASNAWFPIVRSSLVIKGEANPVAVALRKCSEKQIEKIQSIEKLTMYMEDEMFPSLDGFPVEDVWREIQRQRGEIEADETELRSPEWDAFRDPERSSQGEQSDFFLQLGEVPALTAGRIGRVVLARKLLEVRALTGFTRIDYASGFDDAIEGPARAPIYRQRPDWLPAVEVRGEGIFIELDQTALAEWEQRPAVKARAQAMETKYKAWAEERGVEADDFPGARYVLLHTLAHMLIRQLALDCGYSASAVRERIYSSLDPDRSMAGVLLYTASPDSEGSLGGLVDLGSSVRLPGLLAAALKTSAICSSDPLCADHQPDVHATINGAACHACALAPETSCEAFNRFLDRNLLVPTIAHADMAFFDNLPT